MNIYTLIQTIALLCNNQAGSPYSGHMDIRKCHVEYLQCVRAKEYKYLKQNTPVLDKTHLFLEECILERGRKN